MANNSQQAQDLFTAAQICLDASEPEEKLHLTQHYAQAWRDEILSLDAGAPPQPISEPGRPLKPELVPPGDVPKRGLGTAEGRAALLHAVTHIEFNAINLAWDAVYRFRDMPSQFYSDWVRVADEEAYHFQLLRQRLNDMGYDYGDFAAHNGLWDTAQKTAFDPMVRMALVPRVLEARGLDVTPGMMKRLRHVGDIESVSALEIILRDEVGHVEIGSRWFKYFCDQRGLNMEQTFRELISQYFAGQLRGPFNDEARIKAGFSEAELRALEAMDTGA